MIKLLPKKEEHSKGHTVLAAIKRIAECSRADRTLTGRGDQHLLRLAALLADSDLDTTKPLLNKRAMECVA